ncbi:MAG: Na/Pi cotransporter family protein [Puniceicoccaceae bacterium]|nr:MAG: Na/Pi cotransporter family protein [Puniceicoccaceae bacterium]
MFVNLLGGIGLFLLGMLLLTEGLKAFAGDSLRRALLRFTRRPVSAFASGAAVTALVQSSSATTLATIGFVSAGLLTFGQAVGVLYGASLGTTSTGWLVSTLGLKFSISKLALPLVGVGAVLRLFKRGRWSELGLALAGFGLIFIGIDTLQAGMETLADRIDPGSLAGHSFWGHALLMLIGTAMTVVMQSSSAAVATTMAALHTGAIDFDQACSLVIGQAVGTTSTAVIAAIGATTAARRVALAHVLFNLGTALVALLLLPFFTRMIRWLQEHAGLDPGAVSLAAFHTSFILLGVLVFLPLTGRFTRLIERLVPVRDSGATAVLDDSLLAVPTVALEAVRRAARRIALELAEAVRRHLAGEPAAMPLSARKAVAREQIARCEEFLARIPPPGAGDARAATLRIAILHGLDHLTRWCQSLGDAPPPPKDGDESGLLEAANLAQRALQLIAAAFEERAAEADVRKVAEASASLAKLRREHRPMLLTETASATTAPARALAVLDAIRWLDAAAYHGARLAVYLGPDEALPTPGTRGRT